MTAFNLRLFSYSCLMMLVLWAVCASSSTADEKSEAGTLLSSRGVEIHYFPLKPGCERVVISNEAAVSRAEFKLLKLLSPVEDLMVLQPGLSSIFGEIGELKGLKILTLSDIQWKDKYIEAVLVHRATLTTVALYGQLRSEHQLSRLSELHSLTTLALFREDRADDYGIHPAYPYLPDLGMFGRLTQLNRLSLRGVGLSDTDIRDFAPLTKLYELVLHRNPIRGSGFDSLQNLESLVTLSLRDCLISDEYAHHLVHFAKLRQLDLSGNPIGDKGISVLAEGATANNFYLYIQNTQVTDDVYRILAPFSRLDNLSLARNKLTGKGVSQMQQIKAIDFSNCPIAVETIQELTKMPRLIYINLDGVGIHAKDLLQLATLPDLKQLSLLGNHFSDAEKEELKAAMPNCELVFLYSHAN